MKATSERLGKRKNAANHEIHRSTASGFLQMAITLAVLGDLGRSPTGDDDLMATVPAIQTACMRDGTAASFPAFLVEASVNSLSQMPPGRSIGRMIRWQND